MIVLYRVQQGDTIRSIAHRFGVDPMEIVNHEKNAELIESRKFGDDEEVDMPLAPDDLLTIETPAAEPPSVDASTTNKYSAEVPLENIELCFYDDDGPWADEPFSVEGIDPPIVDKTDGQGRLTVSVPLTTPMIVIHFEQRNHRVLHLMRNLDPVKTASGIQQRLTALGLYSGSITSEMNDEATAALMRFQIEQELSEQTGVATDETLAALEDGFRNPPLPTQEEADE